MDKGIVVHNQVTYGSVEPSVWGVLEADVENSKKSPEKDDQEPEQALSPVDSLTVQDRRMEESLTRSTGDFECYKIYLRSMGIGVVVVLIGSIACHVAIQKMPRSYCP